MTFDQLAAGWLGAGLLAAAALAADDSRRTASSAQPDFAPGGAVDGDRFSCAPGRAWKGDPGQTDWWWQLEFPAPRRVGALLQIVGDHAFVFTNAPTRYVWQGSLDGRAWRDLVCTTCLLERRLFRVHRLARPQTCRFLRLRVTAVEGAWPTLREVEVFEDPRAEISFPEWVVAVNTTHDAGLPGHGQEFIPLARACAGSSHLEAQQVWLGGFDRAFVMAEPRPLCAFLSGNFKDWCEVERGWWRGVGEVLERRSLPMWASCGGAQGLALLSEYGVHKRWDCPHCRDPDRPRSPIYTHIGHTGRRPCGDYSACVFERGAFNIRQTAQDPVFAGLPVEFRAMESHCGQIEWPPKGWTLIATAGPGGKTKTQCLRVRDAYIYAAQFHIEMEGVPETSRQIMANFLRLAKPANPRNRGLLP